jgi:UDP-3-O-[3-hydroxymyristoyl] glucosamine N-acyltransferase
MIGGQVGFAGHIILGDGSQVGAQSGVSRTWPGGSKVFGSPAMPLAEELRLQAHLKKMPELVKTINQLVKTVEALSAKKHGQ